MGFSAVNTANNLVYLIVSSFLSFMAVSGFFGRRNILKIDAAIDMPDEIFAGRRVPIIVRLTNKKRHMPGFLLKLFIGRDAVLMPFADAGKATVKTTMFLFPKRGEFELPCIYICSIFPFNFFRRCGRFGKGYKFIVFPKPLKCEVYDIMGIRKMPFGERITDKSGADAEFISLRQYLPGDPQRHINWKASARTESLKTKEFSSSAVLPVVIDFDNLVINDIEERLSCVAYAVLQSYKNNIPVGLKIGGKTYDPDLTTAHKRSLLTALALYGVHQQG